MDEKTRARPEESLAKMVATLKETTGKTLEEWKALIQEKGWVKHGEIVGGIKSEYGVSHGYANQIALHSKKEAGPSTDPTVALFEKRELAKKIYDALLIQIKGFGPDVDLGPKKAYVSVRRKKQFAVLQPAASRLDVGINLKSSTVTERLEASGSFNAMLSHRVKVGSIEEIDPELIGWLREAYDEAG